MKHNNDVLLILKRARAKSTKEEIAAFGKTDIQPSNRRAKQKEIHPEN